jgi:hypothetical protein
MKTTTEAKDPDKMTMAEHAKAWWTEQGKVVPPKGADYDVMYETWAEWAFRDI